MDPKLEIDIGRMGRVLLPALIGFAFGAIVAGPALVAALGLIGTVAGVVIGHRLGRGDIKRLPENKGTDVR